MKRYRNIFWDWNGTLLDDVDECIDIINVSLKKRNLRLLEREEYLEKFRFPVKKYYEAIGFDFSKESFEAAGKEFIEAYSTKMFECRLHSSALEVLQKISAAGLNQYVLSALNDEALQKCVEHYDLADYFESAHGLQDHYAFSKLELGRSLLNGLNIDKNTAILIGDTLHDFEVAQALGIDCILVSAGHNARSRLEKCPVKIYSNLQQLNLLLDELI